MRCADAARKGMKRMMRGSKVLLADQGDEEKSGWTNEVG
jgi:hypothetical protein